MARGVHYVTLLSIFALAMLARLAAIGRYVTPDELNWVYRSLGMRRALLAGDWRQTLQSGHPGVTTTWIGAAMAQLQLALQPELYERLQWLERIQQLSTDNVQAYRHLYAFLNSGRLGVVLVISLGLVLVYLLARKLLPPRAALLGALLLALDPFFAGLSGLLHVDGLLATFCLLALLAALCAVRSSRPLLLAAGAGLFTALAVLTKTPGLILVAFIPPILLWPLAGRLRAAAARPAKQPFAQLAVWALSGALVSLLLLPALWSAPAHVLDVTAGLSGRLIEDAVRPTFFMGELALDHGPIYYPVVTLLRLSPVTFAGLLLAAFAHLRQRGAAPISLRWLLIFSAAFLVAITLAAKKFDRYALPSIVTLALVGAWGLQSTASRLQQNGRLLASALLIQGAFLISTWPHPLTAANWLLGGNAVARHVLPSGWGEDAGLAARRLSEMLEHPQSATLFSSSLTGTAPFFPGQVIRLRTPNLTRLQEDDFILTLPEDRRLPEQPVLQGAPINIAVRGVGFASLQSGLRASDLQLPSFQQETAAMRFGPALRLQATGSTFLPWPQETMLGLTWHVERPEVLAPAYQLQIALADSMGNLWLERETPLLNDADLAPVYWPPGVAQTVFYRMPLPPTLAPGDYVWQLRLFDDEGSLQAVYDHSDAFAGTQAQAAVAVTPPPVQPALEIPNPVASTGPVVGVASLPQTAQAGAPFSLDVWWQASQQRERATLLLEIAGGQSEYLLELSGAQPGQIYRIRPVWRLPLELPAGPHEAALRAVAPDHAPAVRPLALGSLQIEVRERLYRLPPGVEAMQIAAGDLAWLQDVQVELQEQAIVVHIIWQARQTTLKRFTTFVHLRHEGQVIGGDDRQPMPPTNTWAPGELIVESYTLPRPPAGSYEIALGLYDAANGQRAPLRDRHGQRLADDQFALPVEAP